MQEVNSDNQTDFKQFKDELVAKQKELKEYIMREAGGMFKKFFGEVFARFPEIIELSWPQYTPYFNDGDECVFRTCGLQARWVKDGEEYETDYLSESDVKKGLMTQQMYEVLDEVDTMIQANELQDVFKMIFGDHVKVKVTKDGVTTQEYSHD